ncbi:META domain containing protein [Angomonas deanei]|uniref:META domain containing protein n=1 Tax=Angomonas deanei TaxID=59799 RepID=S9VLV2_9TRYP|nr:META domain containing protein [Angomonas deanei]EPY41868.1 META domain containing protein [Angomonas deanei]CAD2221675.1 META domain/Domain of unknown function (DUF1935), putative [Angomonas deanei]|eukprot:EPY33940.1 META domain containing protein [Angomonas deanei]
MIADKLDDICGSYTLTHFKGKNAPTTATLHLAHRKKSVFAFITVANTMRGKLRYENGLLYGDLSSTMMMGDDNQMAIEDAISTGLSTGFKVKVENDNFYLKNDNCSLMFSRNVQLNDVYGEHAVVSINGQKVTEPMSLRFLPDGDGGCFLIANVTNSLRGQLEIQGSELQGSLASTNIPTQGEAEAAEERIVAAFNEGVQIRQNSTGVYLRSQSTTMQLLHIVDADNISGEFVLKAFNGKRVTGEEQSTIHFHPSGDDKVSVEILVANRMRGNVSIENNVLRSDTPFMSTRVMGSEEQQEIETAYNTGFQYGFEANLAGKEGKFLILRNSSSELVYMRVAEIHPNGPGPSYKGTYFNKCFKNQGNGLLFRIVNEPEKKWAYYNDTENYTMTVTGYFGARSSIRPLGKSKMSNENGKYVVTVTVEPGQTEMFIEGTVNGFQVSYNAEAAGGVDHTPQVE